MSVRIGVLGPEDPAHGVHPVKVPGYGHLLVQLGRLRQVRRPFEVGHLGNQRGIPIVEKNRV